MNFIVASLMKYLLLITRGPLRVTDFNMGLVAAIMVCNLSKIYKSTQVRISKLNAAKKVNHHFLVENLYFFSKIALLVINLKA